MFIRRILFRSLVAVAAAGPLVAVAPGQAAAEGSTVTVRISSAAQLAVYDDQDRLGLPGDTHELDVLLGEGSGIIFTTSYECGPHDPAQPPEDLGCPQVPWPHDALDISDATVALSGETARWRATTTAGPLELILAGGTRREWQERVWRYAEGTSRESGRTVVRRNEAPTAQGTLAGVVLAQPDPWQRVASVSRSRTVERRYRGPAVPLPSVPPPGTEQDGWVSVGQASASWERSLGEGVVEVGTVGASDDGSSSFDLTWGSADVTRQQCDPGETPLPPGEQPGPGRCTVIDVVGNELLPYTFTLDPRTATARIDGTVGSTADPPDEQELHSVRAAVRGLRPVGVHRVDTFQAEPGAQPGTTTVSGIRWLRPTGRVTVDGQPAEVTAATMFAFRQRLQFGQR